MEDLNLYKNLYNENYTDARKNDLIQKVFENKTKASLSEKSETIKMDKGGLLEDKIYTPYEFLHELLPTVYGRPYVVSNEVGKQYDEKIVNDQNVLDDYINSKLVEYGVSSIYNIDNKELIEEIEIKRRKLISDKSFITETEIIAYLFTHPQLYTEHYIKEMPNYDVVSYLKQGLIMVDYDKQNDSYLYVYVYEYLSGNLYEKRTRLRLNKSRLMELGVLSEEQFDLQDKELVKNMPTKGKITKDLHDCLFILPSSRFSKEFRIEPEDVMDIEMESSENFIDTFKEWTKTELDLALITKSESLEAVHTYFTDLIPIGNEDGAVYSDFRKKAFIDGKIILMEFMNKGLRTDCQTRLEYEWNEKYNFYTEPKYYKFPVACHLSNKFKNGKVFTPNETQIQSIQFGNSVGSGLLAYGVGVGKTASAILNLSYSLDNNLCKKPIFIVPNATYEKWKMEMFGGVKTIYEVTYIENDNSLSLTFETQGKAEKFAKAVDGKVKAKIENIYGHIPHLNNVVELYNLNEEKTKELKNYTDLEEIQIRNINELLVYLKSLPKDYQFDNVEINNNIRQKYDDFEIDSVRAEYLRFIEDNFNKWWDNKKNKNLANNSYYEGRQYYFANVEKVTLKDYFIKGVKLYREELPYILGTVKTFPDKTIFLATYEALEHLGLLMESNTELRDDDSIYGRLFNEISQGDKVSNINYNVKKNLAVLWRDSVFGKKKTKVDIGQLGIDYAVFDESHFLKKVIMDCKGIPTSQIRGNAGTSMRKPRKYSFGENQYPSTIGLTGYFITRYIQENNNGNNVLHLTATPFTNKPAEIYSMLSLTNRKMLMESGLLYMEEFFDVFMDISFELIFGNTGVARKEALLGYRNLPQLRNLIYSMMDYKSGEDANIKRPEKLLFPSAKNNIETILPETPVQDNLFKQIKNYMRGRIDYSELCSDAIEELDIDELTEEELLDYLNDTGTDAQKEKYEQLEKPLNEEDFDALKNIVQKLYDKKEQLNENQLAQGKERDSFRVVKGLTLLKAVTLSPFLSMCQKEAGVEPTYTQYIESSPKLIYTLNCIKSIHDYELENNLVKSGCVIYMNIGVNVSFKKDGEKFKWQDGGFEKIKQYLINKMGYSADEISIVSGGLSSIEKERGKNRFLSGKSTILIGSSTISTGVDLQNNASSLFLCSYDWNPTDNEQISGRIHRMGNKFEKIRVVYPMIMNSSDPNIFQQLYEKTLRIKNIWDRNDKGNTLDLKDFDVDSLRKGTLDDPEDLAVYWKEELTDELETSDNVLTQRLKDLRSASLDKKEIDFRTPQMKGMIVVIDAYRKYQEKEKAKERMNEKIGTAQSEYDDKYQELVDKLTKKELKGEDFNAELDKAEQKLEKAKDKVKEDIYDFENDPESRYKYLTYDEIGDGDNLFKMVGRFITNSDSYYSKLGYYDELADIYRGWLRDNFPRFQNGKYDLSLPEEEDTINRYLDYQSASPRNYAYKWKGAYRGFGKVKEKLKILGIEFEEIPQAIDLINAEKERISQELENVEQQLPTKLQEFTLAKEERLVIQSTIQQRVDEFSAFNYILHEVVPTLPQDRQKFVEAPAEKLPIVPSVKEIAKVIEEAVIKKEEPKIEKEEPKIEEEVGVDTSELIANLKNGLLIRFDFGMKPKGKKVIDLFFEEGDLIKFSAFENSNGEIIEEEDQEEEVLTEQQIIHFYKKYYDKILEQFYDDGTVEQELEEVVSESDVKLKDWYIKNYPTDDLGEAINDVNTFEDLWNGLHSNINVYDIIGYGDSILRERFFQHLAEIKGVDYDYIYDKWLGQVDLENYSIKIDKSIENKEVSKGELYNELIEGYELALELETDEEKIKMYNDLIEGYQLALELEN